MNKKHFNIVRWDIIKDSCDNTLKPMVYFKPDLESLEIIRKNNNRLRVNIEGTKDYDKVYNATIDRSSDIPNCRPNFYDATQLYIATLDTFFNYFPESHRLGRISLNMGIYVPESLKKEMENAKNPEEMVENDEEDHEGEKKGEKKGKKKDKKKGKDKHKRCDHPLKSPESLLIIILIVVIIISAFFLILKNKK